LRNLETQKTALEEQKQKLEQELAQLIQLKQQEEVKLNALLKEIQQLDAKIQQVVLDVLSMSPSSPRGLFVSAPPPFFSGLSLLLSVVNASSDLDFEFPA
jgi:hypothetical protein